MLTLRELATVLATLRYWQQDLAATDELIDGEAHFDEHAPLSVEQIDQLCERLTFAVSQHAALVRITHKL